MVYLLSAAALAVLVLWLVYRMAFYSDRGGWMDPYAISPKGEYQARREEMLALIGELAQRPFERVYLTSHDGLRLTARYYHTADGAPLDIAFHGYRGHAWRDFCGGSRISFALGHNLLLVDQRAHGESDGHTISFGIKERWDCRDWANYATKRFGKETKVILSGVSMGAATVLMASELDLPDTVAAITADCPYSAPGTIIRKVTSDVKLPPWLIYPFVVLGAFVFGHFCLWSSSPVKAVRNTKIPILLIHGEDDRFVPCNMSREIRDACRGPAVLVTFPEAGHGLSYLTDTARYHRIYREFFRICKITA